MNKDEIKPDEYYSPSILMSTKTFPWMKSVMTFMSILKSERGKELFKPIVKSTGKTKRYYIKGEDVINVLELADRGELTL